MGLMILNEEPLTDSAVGWSMQGCQASVNCGLMTHNSSDRV